MMNEENDPLKRFIYITPFLNEVSRIKESVTSRKFHEPKNLGEGKLESLKRLITNQVNIVSTHALFQMADTELIELMQLNNYTLILDEVVNVIEQIPLGKDDLKLLIDTGILNIGEDGYATWNDDTGYIDTRYNYIRSMAKSGNLIINRNSALMWTFPVNCFKAFEEIYILTYMFKAQYQKYYYDMHELKYTYYSVQLNNNNRYNLIPYGSGKDERIKYKKLINIYEGKLNDIGEYSLSSTWLKDAGGGNKHKIQQLKKNTYNYFTNITKGNSEVNMWTTLKHSQHKLKGRGYTKGFVEHTARATNEFSSKTKLAYLMNKFMLPIEKSFFTDRQIPVDEDSWALSELIQWIFRSTIRNDKEIDIYIPSKRMRKILQDWLNGI